MTAGRKAALGIVLVAAAAALVFLEMQRAAQVSPQPAPYVPAKAGVEPARPMVQIVMGHIEAQHTISVDIAKPGQIEALYADVGEAVTEGQILARLASGAPEPVEDTAAQRKVDTLKAAIEESKLQTAKAKADAGHAKDEVTRAERLFELQQKLNEAGATPRRTFEQARDELAKTQKESSRVEEAWRQAENRTYALNDQLREAAAALDSANKRVEAARAAFNASEIHAPASGIVVARKGQIGQQTGPAEGKEVFQIAVDVSLLRALFDTDKATAARLRPGTQVLITIPNLQGPPLPLSISAVEGLHAQADFTSPSSAILPGMPCSVSVQLK